MWLSESSKVYEALGDYVHSLCHSQYLGTARGSAVVYGEHRVSLTAEGDLPFISVFYSHCELEVISVDGENALSVRMKPESVSYDGPSGAIEIVFPEMDGVLVVTLMGNRGLFRTIKGAVESCGKRRGRREFISSVLAEPVP